MAWRGILTAYGRAMTAHRRFQEGLQSDVFVENLDEMRPKVKTAARMR